MRVLTDDPADLRPCGEPPKMGMEGGVLMPDELLHKLSRTALGQWTKTPSIATTRAESLADGWAHTVAAVEAKARTLLVPVVDVAMSPTTHRDLEDLLMREQHPVTRKVLRESPLFPDGHYLVVDAGGDAYAILLAHPECPDDVLVVADWWGKKFEVIRCS